MMEFLAKLFYYLALKRNSIKIKNKKMPEKTVDVDMDMDNNIRVKRDSSNFNYMDNSVLNPVQLASDEHDLDSEWNGHLKKSEPPTSSLPTGSDSHFFRIKLLENESPDSAAELSTQLSVIPLVLWTVFAITSSMTVWHSFRKAGRNERRRHLKATAVIGWMGTVLEALRYFSFMSLNGQGSYIPLGEIVLPLFLLLAVYHVAMVLLTCLEDLCHSRRSSNPKQPTLTTTKFIQSV